MKRKHYVKSIATITFILNQGKEIKIFENYGAYIYGFSYDGNYFVIANDGGIIVVTKVNKMVDFSVNEMQKMQKELQEKYQDKWERICAETGKNKLLWMIGEIGEVIDIVKKNGGNKVSADELLRNELIEEMADVLMYYNDVMLCYGITTDELKQAYIDKFERNMKRWQSSG